MTILNISEYYQLVIRGCIFLGAVCLDGIQKKLAGKKSEEGGLRWETIESI